MGGPGLFDCWIFIRTPHRESVVSQKAGLIRTFTMSNTPFKCIVLIIKRIHFGDLLDCPLLAIKTPFHPKSSRCSFSECLYTKHFPMHALLDPSRRLHPLGENEPPHGKVYRFCRNSRHFPGRERLRVLRERPVEPVPRSAAGESEPFSRKSPALSPEVEMASAAREACGAGTPSGHGGK